MSDTQRTDASAGAPGRMYRVRTRGLERRMRAGLVFGRQAVVVALSQAQLALVQADAQLLATPEPMPELELAPEPDQDLDQQPEATKAPGRAKGPKARATA